MNALARAIAVAVPVLVIASGCGGGSGGSSAPPFNGGTFVPTASPGPTASPTPTATPTPPPSSSSASTKVAENGVALSLGPIAGGVTASFTIAANGFTGPAGATVNGTLSSTPPAGVPAPQSGRRATRTLPVNRAPRTVTHAAQDYLAITTDGFTTSATLGVTFTVPNASASQAYYLAFYDGTGWQYDVAGPVFPQSGGAIVFSIPLNGQTFNFKAGMTYVFALTADTVVADAKATVQATYTPPASLQPPEQITQASDGSLWFVANSQGVVTAKAFGRIDPSGTMTQAPGGPFAVVGMTATPDGRVWFAANSNNNGVARCVVGTVNSSGPTILATSSSRYFTCGAIAVGPDGNVWVGENNGSDSAFGRVSVANGSFQEFTGFTPNGGSGQLPGIVALAAGPDGNLWFAASGTAGHIDTSGNNFVAFTVPPPAPLNGSRFSFVVTSIAAAGDGSMVVGGFDQPQNGTTTGYMIKLSTSGQFGARYAVPGNIATQLVTAGDGSVWMLGSGTLGRLTPSQQFTRETVPFGISYGTKYGTGSSIAGSTSDNTVVVIAP